MKKRLGAGLEIIYAMKMKFYVRSVDLGVRKYLNGTVRRTNGDVYSGNVWFEDGRET